MIKKRMIVLFRKVKKLYIYIRNFLKLFIAYVVLHIFERELLKKNIWLIREKKTEARDNGYHLFVYLREKRPEINSFFVITPDSADIDKVNKYGNLVMDSTFQHCIYYLAAHMNISSQPLGAIPFDDDRRFVEFVRPLRNKNQKHIDLKHGIHKDKIDGERKLKRDMVVFASKREQQFIVESYEWNKQTTRVVGLCRYDKLINIEIPKRTILIMPTARHWLSAKDQTHEATEREKEMFSKSSFFLNYEMLLTNRRLIKILEMYDYNCIFYPHYSAQSYISMFKKCESSRIVIADRFNFDVQTLLKDSAILITDFSSVFFDFAYMLKPEIYYQFDINEYRAKQWESGYFEYLNDGFGPVVITEQQLLDELEHLLITGTKMEEMYQKRVEKFFEFRDTDNCKRTTDAILDLK